MTELNFWAALTHVEIAGFFEDLRLFWFCFIVFLQAFFHARFCSDSQGPLVSGELIGLTMSSQELLCSVYSSYTLGCRKTDCVLQAKKELNNFEK